MNFYKEIVALTNSVVRPKRLKLFEEISEEIRMKATNGGQAILVNYSFNKLDELGLTHEDLDIITERFKIMGFSAEVFPITSSYYVSSMTETPQKEPGYNLSIYWKKE